MDRETKVNAHDDSVAADAKGDASFLPPPSKRSKNEDSTESADVVECAGNGVAGKSESADPAAGPLPATQPSARPAPARFVVDFYTKSKSLRMCLLLALHDGLRLQQLSSVGDTQQYLQNMLEELAEALEEGPYEPVLAGIREAIDRLQSGKDLVDGSFEFLDKLLFTDEQPDVFQRYEADFNKMVQHLDAAVQSGLQNALSRIRGPVVKGLDRLWSYLPSVVSFRNARDRQQRLRDGRLHRHEHRVEAEVHEVAAAVAETMTRPDGSMTRNEIGVRVGPLGASGYLAHAEASAAGDEWDRWQTSATVGLVREASEILK